MNNLELGLVGNSSVAALVDERGEIAWACWPRFDGDAMFCSLLRERGRPGAPRAGAGAGGAVGTAAPPQAAGGEDFGFLAIDLADFARAEQAYVDNTPVLVTRLHDGHGGAVEIVDHAPRLRQFGRLFCPATLVRTVRPVAGTPRIRVRMRPAADYGRVRAPATWGSNHIRYIGSDFVLRLTTDVSVTAIIEETEIVLRYPFSMILGADETLQGPVAEVARRFQEQTIDYWQDWVRDLSIPFEWQDEVIRAAITLKLNAYDDTGAIIAAVTTSIPEAAGSTRNWDYRYCWLRDAYFVVNALNRLNATRTMERYLGWIINVTAGKGARLQPVYTVSGRADLDEREIGSLPGYRGMGPVRVGNLAYRQVQNDVFGSAVLAATHVFFDRRLHQTGNEALFGQLETLGELAVQAHDQPDAGLWELRGSARVHTFSSVMCWVACDRLAKIAARFGRPDRVARWSEDARRIRSTIERRAWNERMKTFVSAFEGDALDASLLLLAELGFVHASDPRFAATVAAVERELRRGDFVFRYSEADDFGIPQNAFVVCAFWYIEALAAIGRREEARSLFDTMLRRRTRLGLFAEHIDTGTGELWGNFPQTYSMVGLINCATKLSIPWEGAF